MDAHKQMAKMVDSVQPHCGEPISAAALPAKSDDAIDVMKRATLALGGRYAPTVSLVQNTRLPSWAR